MSAWDLIDKINDYGRIELLPGDDAMRIPRRVPAKFRRALANQFWDVKAILEEWECTTSTDAVLLAEALIKNS